MKKFILISLFVLLAATPVFAENIVSLSTGMNTGLIGFTFEKLFNYTSYNLGFGMTPESLRTAVEARIYMPDTHNRSDKRRSNVYLAPNAGIIWTNMDPGYECEFWAGLTAGYDHRWGEYKQYRLTVEGGFGLTQEDTFPNTPIINISLGYVF